MEFAKQILSEFLGRKGIRTTPIFTGSGRHTGGGNVSVERVAHTMVRLYWSFDAATSLVDCYGFRSKGVRTAKELEECLRERTHQKITRNSDPRKILPYVHRHEFESLLFSDVSAFSQLPDAPTDPQTSSQKIRSRFPTPEDINDNQSTAPNKRILRANRRKAFTDPIVWIDSTSGNRCRLASRSRPGYACMSDDIKDRG